MHDIRNNKIRSIFCEALRSTALLCVTGPIMQTFLASLGFSSQFLYFNNTLVQAANVITIMLCSQWADRGNIVKRVALLEIPAHGVRLPVTSSWQGRTLPALPGRFSGSCRERK